MWGLWIIWNSDPFTLHSPLWALTFPSKTVFNRDNSSFPSSSDVNCYCYVKFVNLYRWQRAFALGWWKGLIAWRCLWVQLYIWLNWYYRLWKIFLCSLLLIKWGTNLHLPFFWFLIVSFLDELNLPKLILIAIIIVTSCTEWQLVYVQWVWRTSDCSFYSANTLLQNLQWLVLRTCLIYFAVFYSLPFIALYWMFLEYLVGFSV